MVVKYIRASLHKVFAVMAALLFLVGIVPLNSVSAAGVNAMPSSCGAGQVCLYRDKKFGGDQLKVTVVGSPCVSAGFLNDKATSVANNTGRYIRYYQGNNCDGLGCHLDDSPHSYRENLALNVYSGGLPCGNFSPNDDIGSFFLF